MNFKIRRGLAAGIGGKGQGIVGGGQLLPYPSGDTRGNWFSPLIFLWNSKLVTHTDNPNSTVQRGNMLWYYTVSCIICPIISITIKYNEDRHICKVIRGVQKKEFWTELYNLTESTHSNKIRNKIFAKRKRMLNNKRFCTPLKVMQQLAHSTSHTKTAGVMEHSHHSQRN